MSADPFYTYGPPELCVWKVAPATFWFQTTDPRYSRKLDQRQDTRRVAVTGVNHYRRTCEMRGNWRKVKGIVNRYLMRTSDTFFGAVARQSALEIAPKVRTAGRQKSRKLREVAGPICSASHLKDLAAAAARVFGWDSSGKGTGDTYNTLVVTSEQLDQIRALRGTTDI